jgi:hypothetical protein
VGEVDPNINRKEEQAREATAEAEAEEAKAVAAAELRREEDARRKSRERIEQEENKKKEAAINMEFAKSEAAAKRDDMNASIQLALQKGKTEWGRSKIMIVGEGRAGMCYSICLFLCSLNYFYVILFYRLYSYNCIY